MPTSPRLLDQVREKLRLKHYSIRTERAYLDWIKRFILFHGKKHPAAMANHEVETFLTYLAVENGAIKGGKLPEATARRAAAGIASTHR